MKVSKNFSLKELIRTDCRMDNTPDSRALMNIAVLAARILQPVRDEFGPVRVSSCFRCKEVNAAIGGSETSDHVAGDGTTTGTAAAADFEVISEEISNLQLGEWIRDNLEFKQLI
ncbi:MAG: D-Ala-D-Ala carboxypeptidase family metallohydrolase, partial [bacterium]